MPVKHFEVFDVAGTNQKAVVLKSCFQEQVGEGEGEPEESLQAERDFYFVRPRSFWPNKLCLFLDVDHQNESCESENGLNKSILMPDSGQATKGFQIKKK